MKFRIIFILLSVIMIYSSSCKKFLDIGTPRTSIPTEALFVDSANTSSAILAMYTRIMTFSVQPTIGSGMLSLAGGLSADELVNYSTGLDFIALYQNTLTSTTSTNSSLWNEGYAIIYQANICIEGIEASKTLPEALKIKYIAEAKFVRAFIYFYLINLYGDVPYVTTTNFNLSFGKGRTPVATIYAEIKKDLRYAQENLPSKYPTTASGAAVGRIRPIDMAATALLARVYLYTKDWENAVAASSKVIASPLHSGLASLAESFLKDNKEAIWQLQPVTPNYNTVEGIALISNGLTVSYGLQPSLLADFEKNNLGEIVDQRFTNWVKRVDLNGVTYYHPFKYKVRTGAVITENYTMLRLAEQYLIRAEANTALKNTDAVVDDLNVIRARAALLPLNKPMDVPSCEAAVMQERRIELFSEWGHRWLDLKRTGKADAVLAPLKSKWLSTAVLFPIPAAELNKDPSLIPNPGYN